MISNRVLSALIFLAFSSNPFAQAFTDLLGKSNYSAGKVYYNSDSGYVEGYSLFCSSNLIPQVDSSTSIHSIKFDSSLNIIASNRLGVSKEGTFHYYHLKWIENWKSRVIAHRYDITKRSSGGFLFPFNSNCDLCEITLDSMYSCIPLFPNSAYAGEVTGSYLDGDSLIVIGGYALGANSVPSDYQQYRISIDTSSFQIKRRIVSYRFNGVDYTPRAYPFKMPDGRWFVQVSRDSAQVSGGMAYAIVSPNWDSLVKIINVGSINNIAFNRAWHYNNKLVFLNTEILNPHLWNQGDPIQEQLTLVEYDYINDSIANRYKFDFSSRAGVISHHIGGFDAMFNGSHFVISFLRSVDWSAGSPSAIGVAIIDSNFTKIGSVVIDDTSSSNAYLNGFINALTSGTSPNEFYYMGYVDDPDVNPGGIGADLILGKIDFNTIGLVETISIKRQQTWMYPNPNNGTFKLTNTAQPFKDYQFSIFDSKGVGVYKGKADNPKQDFSVKLTFGVYYLVTHEGDVISFIAE